ncbi:MAG: zinc dependent phospholipase C family protein [Pseudomonadales bacterium]
MPFTPIHLGPAAFLKSILGPRFSFVVFGGSQVLIDLEPLIQIIRGADVLHGPSHTLLGALVFGVLASLLGKPIGEYFLQLIRYTDTRIAWAASCCGAFLGTFSHILLDGIMHADMSPWVPLSQSNTLLDAITVTELHLLCYGLGIAGGSILALKYYLQKTANKDTRPPDDESHHGGV